MTCEVCGGLGMLIQEWTDAAPDFSVCLCPAGQAFRVSTNNGRTTIPQWRVWCARYQVDPCRVFLLEEIYTPAELATVGFGKPEEVNREAALLAAGRKARR